MTSSVEFCVAPASVTDHGVPNGSPVFANLTSNLKALKEIVTSTGTPFTVTDPAKGAGMNPGTIPITQDYDPFGAANAIVVDVELLDEPSRVTVQHVPAGSPVSVNHTRGGVIV